MRRDAQTWSWIGLFAVSGWLLQMWVAGAFGPYALVLIGAGVLGMAGTGSLLVAPLGLLVGQLAAIFALAPHLNWLEIGVTVAAISIPTLAGMVARAFGLGASKRHDD